MANNLTHGPRLLSLPTNKRSTHCPSKPSRDVHVTSHATTIPRTGVGYARSTTPRQLQTACVDGNCSTARDVAARDVIRGLARALAAHELRLNAIDMTPGSRIPDQSIARVFEAHSFRAPATEQDCNDPQHWPTRTSHTDANAARHVCSAAASAKRREWKALPNQARRSTLYQHQAPLEQCARPQRDSLERGLQRKAARRDRLPQAAEQSSHPNEGETFESKQLCPAVRAALSRFCPSRAHGGIWDCQRQAEHARCGADEAISSDGMGSTGRPGVVQHSHNHLPYDAELERAAGVRLASACAVEDALPDSKGRQPGQRVLHILQQHLLDDACADVQESTCQLDAQAMSVEGEGYQHVNGSMLWTAEGIRGHCAHCRPTARQQQRERQRNMDTREHSYASIGCGCICQHMQRKDISEEFCGNHRSCQKGAIAEQQAHVKPPYRSARHQRVCQPLECAASNTTSCDESCCGRRSGSVADRHRAKSGYPGHVRTCVDEDCSVSALSLHRTQDGQGRVDSNLWPDRESASELVASELQPLHHECVPVTEADRCAASFLTFCLDVFFCAIAELHAVLLEFAPLAFLFAASP
jgi:hypothetical protein